MGTVRGKLTGESASGEESYVSSMVFSAYVLATQLLKKNTNSILYSCNS